MLTTYKELFERFATGDGTEEYYHCTDEIYIKTPAGHSQIHGVFQKTGKGVRLTLEGGHEIRAEERHTILSSAGWVLAGEAKDIKHEDGTFKKVLNTEPTDDVQFYDICIDHPHAYYDTQGFVHHNTFTIMKTIKDAGMVQGKDYVKLSGKASPLSLYQTLFMYREGGLVVFDDLDSMWRNEDATNILKAALDTSPVREISWGSSSTINVSKMDEKTRKALFARIDRQLSGETDAKEETEEDDPEAEDTPKRGKKKDDETKVPSMDKIKFPSTFDFTGRVIFISNLKREEFDSAIMSRSAKINMDLTQEEILKRMRTILPDLGGDSIPINKKEELLDHLLSMHKKREIDAVTMREFIKGMTIVASGAPNWRDLIKYA